MISHPSMTSRGKTIAGFIAILILLLLPKRVECGFPDGKCGHQGMFRQLCKDYELEPLGFYAIELLVHRDVGFAYTHGEECR